MKRFILYISILFLGLAYVTNAQTTVSLPDTVVTVGPTTLNIPIIVQEFDNVGAISLTITYSESVLDFQGIANAAATGFSVNDVDGRITIGWFSTDGVTPISIPADGKLLDLTFDYTSGSSNLTFVTANGASEIASLTSTVIPTAFNSGSISSPMRVSLDHVQADPGDTVSVPLRALNLTNVGAISLRIDYDSSVLEFLGLEDDQVNFTSVNASGGTLIMGWFSSDGQPFNMTDAIMANIRFVFSGDASDLTFFTFNGETEISDIDANVLNVAFVNGSVTTDRNVSLPSLRATPGTDVSFPLSVTNLSVGSAQIDITYDPAVLTFLQLSNSAGDGAVANVVSPGRLRIAYIDAAPDFTSGVLFNLDFTYVGDSTVLSFDQTQTSFTDELGAVYSGFVYVDGRIAPVLNTVPVFTSVLQDTTISEGQLLTFQYTATDADGDTLTFSLVNPPVGATIDSETGEFTWTPDLDQAGTDTITVNVTDGTNIVTTSAIVTVTNLNNPPVFVNTIGTADTVIPAEQFTFQYTATDADGDELTFSLFEGPAGSSMTEDGLLTYQPQDSGITVTIIVGVSDGIVTVFDTSYIPIYPTDVHVGPGIPTEYAVTQNFPNPFNPVTTIKFSIPSESHVTLKIYNLLGEEVASLLNEVMPYGNYEFSFDASSLSSGVYIYRIQAGDFISSKKMTLVK